MRSYLQVIPSRLGAANWDCACHVLDLSHKAQDTLGVPNPVLGNRQTVLVLAPYEGEMYRGQSGGP